MKITCRKKKFPRYELRFKVSLSEDEHKKYNKHGHELKCYLWNEEDRLKDTNDFTFRLGIQDYYFKEHYTEVSFTYVGRNNPAIVYNFEMTFPHQKNFEFNKVSLYLLNNQHYDVKAEKLLKQKACQNVREIIQHLLDRDNQGCFCCKCKDKFYHNLHSKCELIYSPINYNSQVEKTLVDLPPEEDELL